MRCEKCNELFRDDAEKCPYCGEGNPLGVAMATDSVKFWIQALTGSPILIDYYGTDRPAQPDKRSEKRGYRIRTVLGSDVAMAFYNV